MPQFFNKATLTPNQKARWDGAMVEYDRIQEINLERELFAMSDSDKTAFLGAFKGTDPEGSVGLKDRMRQLRGCMGGRAGDCKSALFARLLDGKAAFPFPPPTSYSYPWYELIEGDGPFDVMLGGAQTMGAAMTGSRGAEGEFCISINQCTWAIVSMNDAARALMSFQEQLSATAVPEKEGSFYYQYTWSPELYKGVIDAYAAKPEFTVRHGDWAAHKLRLGRGESQSRRRWAEESIREVETQRPKLSKTGSVFDAYALSLNGVIGETISKGEHPQKLLDDARSRLADKGKGGEQIGFAIFDREDINQQLSELEQNIADFEANPNRDDFVKFSYDNWVLEKPETPC